MLFDLDGTLADTAPDLAFALNEVLREQGCAPLPYAQIRPVVSHGGIALIKLGFNIDETAPQFDTLRQRLLAIYREHIVRDTTLFEGIAGVLETIESRGLKRGVATSKPAWRTERLVERLALRGRAVTVSSGDTRGERKPHPAPMLLACEQAGSTAAQCLYVGDAERDIEAGRNAGMQTLVALFGYIGEGDRPEQWQADGMVDEALAIIGWLS
mgnify:CR=1 FL=1